MGWNLAHVSVRLCGHESNCSLLWRVAAAQGVDISFLLAELGEGDPGQQAVQPHLAEVFLSGPAAERLALMLGVPVPRLRWALPHLREIHLLPGQQARWDWPWYPMEHCLVPACSRCVALRGGGWGPIWLVWPEPWKVCGRHGQFTHVRQVGSGVDLAHLGQVVRAHRRRQRFERRHGFVGSYLVADAFAITGWWWRKTVVVCWEKRARRAGRPGSEAESAWLWMYPEAVAVAGALLDYERHRAACPGGAWAAAEAELLERLAQLAAVLGLPPWMWQVPVAQWLHQHHRCTAPVAQRGGPVRAAIHLGDGQHGSLGERCCLPWDWSDLSVPV
ncbi:hypothetical protein QIS99_31355 [Streptomyces sp. B-S-A8]|uniref:TniQ protein n=1 Tax=Streptomyces solicavernae TaxID=3043614 RepID=A0ABT6S1W8_9ACTN|nr:hypothetical protein [Streptomyces sp. B-S-A8]MDI3390659.1 hypothetical protein [Streptomyces sp. B-S-A8]